MTGRKKDVEAIFKVQTTGSGEVLMVASCGCVAQTSVESEMCPYWDRSELPHSMQRSKKLVLFDTGLTGFCAVLAHVRVPLVEKLVRF